MNLLTLARRVRLALITRHLRYAEKRRAQTGPDAYGDALITRLRRQRLILRGRLLMSVQSIHARRDLIVCAVIFLAAPPVIVIRMLEVAA